MRRNLKRLGLTMALVGILSAWAAPAWAPKHLIAGPPTIEGTCFGDEAVGFTGTFEARSFSVADDTLMVTGVASGTCEGGHVKEEPVSEEVTGPAVLDIRCTEIGTFAHADVTSAEGKTLSLGRAGPFIQWVYDSSTDKVAFGKDICKASDLLEAGRIDKVAKVLNKILTRDYDRNEPGGH